VLLLAGVLLLPADAPAASLQAGVVSPARPIQWQPMEVRFQGPSLSETSTNPNPFLFYRLNVTFTGPSDQEYVVPGFFAGDGRGGAGGDVWKVRFSPDASGFWQYEASFRRGPNVAVELSPTAGDIGGINTPNGARGSFTVASRDWNAPGLLKWGRLEYIGAHYLKFRDGPYFIKGGTNSPENFLAYAGFDNTVDQDGNFLHQYADHIADWRTGDPDWNDGAGRGIIGALNYLGSQGVNSIYFLPLNLGGDGQDTYPFVGPEKTSFNKTHYDLSKLEQWNTVLAHAQRQGMQLHIVLAETEAPNEQWLDDGELGVERKLFYRELVARFGYVLAIKWNLSEENDYPIETLRRFAEYLAAVDPYDHPISVHTKPNDFRDYEELLGVTPFAVTSIQYDPDRAAAQVNEWRRRSAAAGRPWVIDMDENMPADEGLTDGNTDNLRKRALYDVYFNGGTIEWYAGYHDLPLGGDLRLENFRTREAMWQDMRAARRLMEAYMPFWQMQPADALLSGASEAFGGGEVLAQPGVVYAVYLPQAEPSGVLDLTDTEVSQAFEQRWFNPRTGTFAGLIRTVQGGRRIELGSPPADPNEDWVVLMSRQGFPPVLLPQAYLPLVRE
jgi:hypothetical protein